MYDYYDLIPCRNNYYRQPTTGMPAAGQQQPQFAMPTYPLPAIGTTLPTGVPAGPTTAPFPAVPGMAQFPADEISPITTQGTMYTAGYLKTQIGKRVRVEFLIGTGTTTDRIGTLLGVGASYILIQPEETDDVMLCDMYSIKFVTFYY